MQFWSAKRVTRCCSSCRHSLSILLGPRDWRARCRSCSQWSRMQTMSLECVWNTARGRSYSRCCVLWRNIQCDGLLYKYPPAGPAFSLDLSSCNNDIAVCHYILDSYEKVAKLNAFYEIHLCVSSYGIARTGFGSNHEVLGCFNTSSSWYRMN